MITREEQKANKLIKCKNFNGTINKFCDAGVNYNSARDQERPFILACLPSGKHLHCHWREYPTKEEVEQEEKELSVIVSNMFVVRKAIIEKSNYKRGKNRGGEIDCPICKIGKVHYSISGYNGHISAQCTTKDCVQWVE